MKDNSNTPSLKITINPGTVYVSTVSNQTSCADLTISVQNISGGTLAINGIAITLPAGLAPVNSLGSITAVPGEPSLWNFQKSQFGAGEYDASSVSGTSVIINSGDIWTFILNGITLVNTITHTPEDVAALVTFADKSEFAQTLPVNLLTTTSDIAVFTASLSNIKPGETTTLSWQCEEMDYCIIVPGDGGPLSTQGSLNKSPQSTTVYTLYAYGDGVILSAQYGITVENPQVIKFGIAGGQTNVDLGGYVTLSWTCNDYVKSISINSSTAVIIPLDLPPQTGSVSLGPIFAPTTFTLYGYGSDKNNFDTRLAFVSINDVTAALSATPSTGLWVQDEITLSWAIANATAVSITPPVANGPSLQNLSGSVTYTPAAGVTGLTFTLSANGFVNGLQNTVNSIVTLSFEQVSITTFAMSPRIIIPVTNPNQAELLWTAQAEQVSINNGIGAVSPAGAVQVNSPANGTVYVLSAGTNQNPVIISQQLEITNAYGPYIFNGFYRYMPIGNPFVHFTIFPVENLMQMSQYLPDQLMINITGVTVGGQPVTQPLQAQVGEAPGYGIGFIMNVPYYFEWADPNSPSGIITIC